MAEIQRLGSQLRQEITFKIRGQHLDIIIRKKYVIVNAKGHIFRVNTKLLIISGLS